MGGQKAKWNELYIETEDQGISRNTDCPIFQFTKVDIIYFSILQYNGQHKYIYMYLDWANPELLTNDKNICQLLMFQQGVVSGRLDNVI